VIDRPRRNAYDPGGALACNWQDGRRRAIFVVFTLRRRGDDILIRPISARYMHDKEVKSYEKENPNL
jgi:uncharacterized DUF497 family protein